MFIDFFLDFPVLIFGQILKNKKFKPMCICVSNKEDILAYQFVFEYIAENARIPQLQDLFFPYQANVSSKYKFFKFKKD